jgi:glycosyltransferase involved in cell wall biosynthesis
MKKISLVSGCYNEVDNLEELFAQASAVLQKFPEYEFEYIFIDNASTDGTQDLLRRMAKADKRIKVILNTRNFGHIRSPYYGLMQAYGDAAIYLASDLQDPPEIIEKFIVEWQKGAKIVLAIKNETEEALLFSTLRRLYYELVFRMANVEMIRNATGFGLYDRVVMDAIRKIQDPYPYFRGLICELGYPIARIPFFQPLRKRGITKANFYILYDMAMLGITEHSKVPLRLATMLGFAAGGISLHLALPH